MTPLNVDTIQPASWWLEEALAADPGEACPPLAEDLEADVVVVGGGYLGLWSAWFVTELDPSAKVVVLEQDIVGGGPSGRNGGFLNGKWTYLPLLRELFGAEAAVAVADASLEPVDGIGAWAEQHGVDIWYRKAGYLHVSTSAAQDGGHLPAVQAAAEVGRPEMLLSESQEQVRARCDSPLFRAGGFDPNAASVQPARLARGLRRVLLERGVRIFEHSRVEAFAEGPPVTARTAGGSVRAAAGVLAVNAWAAAIPPFRRYVTKTSSHMVLTEPLPEAIEELGWTGGECIADGRTLLHYFRTTPDGRIAIGGGGGRPGFGGHMDDSTWRDPRCLAEVEAAMRRYFPPFATARVTHSWGGPIDVSAHHLPLFGTLAGGRVGYGFGFTGNGVGPCRMGGRILASLVLGQDDEHTRLAIVNGEPGRFPPEPLRWVGGMTVWAAFLRKERCEDEGLAADAITDLAAHMPELVGVSLTRAG